MNQWASHLGEAAEFTLKNFATPIAFFLMFRAHGAKPAISLALIVTAVALAIHWLFKIKISPFFMVASGFTVILGGIDLVVQTPRFFRLEPFAQNFIMGVGFLITVYTNKPIAQWFAASLPEKVRPEINENTHPYLKSVTLVWSIYFLLKSGFFLYLAFHVDLGRLILLRSVIGGGSMALMFGVEFAYRKLVWEKSATQ